MSYCRFTKDSDVYAYECDGGVQFWVAVKANNGLDRLCNTYNEAYQYAMSLRDEHGLDVPDYAIDALRYDALEEVKRFNGPKSVVAELKSENAKLREMTAEMYPYARAYTQLGLALGCNDSVSYDWYLQLRELGIEVSE